MLKPLCQENALRRKEEFREALTVWFSKNGRDYPWRRTTDPYAILVSEVMLQQTQIATVLGRGFYQRFLQAFPTVESLAVAEDEPLLKAWEGLGYYRRARMLRDTARAVVTDYDGIFPEEPDALLALPGVGRYTMGALRAFAFGLPAVLVDGNVARVLSRVFDDREPVDDGPGVKRMWRWAEELADPENPRAYHAALMELGQTICRPGVPDCLSCPVAVHCRTREPEKLPVKKQKIAMTEIDEHAIWLCDAKGRVLLHRESGKRRQGLWKLPTRPVGDIGGWPVLAELRYPITRYRVTLRVHDGRELADGIFPLEGEEWIEGENVPDLPMPAPFRRVIERLFEEL
ncbi:MAG: A/G-specific adenine glycosylase [Luteolibacter sp.]